VRVPPFQALLDAHGRDVHRFLTSMVGAVDADDCYQETWLAALRAYPRLRDAANLRSWILTVAHRKAIDHVRAGARRAVPVAEVAETGAATGSPPAVVSRSAAASISAGPVDEDLWAGVGALPGKQRTAIVLRFVLDEPYAEIGIVMQTSEEAARRNVHEGLKRLRKEYRP
jgi:RNA polymerase sigma factor (sigma-70 family)